MECNNVNCKYFIKKDKKPYKSWMDRIFEVGNGCKYPYCKLRNQFNKRK